MASMNQKQANKFRKKTKTQMIQKKKCHHSNSISQRKKNRNMYFFKCQKQKVNDNKRDIFVYDCSWGVGFWFQSLTWWLMCVGYICVWSIETKIIAMKEKKKLRQTSSSNNSLSYNFIHSTIQLIRLGKFFFIFLFSPSSPNVK